MTTTDILRAYKHDLRIYKDYRAKIFSKYDYTICGLVLGLLLCGLTLLFSFYNLRIRYITLSVFACGIVLLIFVIYKRAEKDKLWLKELTAQQLNWIKESTICDYGHFNPSTRIYGEYIVTSDYIVKYDAGTFVHLNELKPVGAYSIIISNTIQLYIDRALYTKLSNVETLPLILNYVELLDLNPSKNGYDFYTLLGGLKAHRDILDGANTTIDLKKGR